MFKIVYKDISIGLNYPEHAKRLDFHGLELKASRPTRPSKFDYSLPIGRCLKSLRLCCRLGRHPDDGRRQARVLSMPRP